MYTHIEYPFSLPIGLPDPVLSALPWDMPASSRWCVLYCDVVSGGAITHSTTCRWIYSRGGGMPFHYLWWFTWKTGRFGKHFRQQLSVETSLVLSTIPSLFFLREWVSLSQIFNAQLFVVTCSPLCQHYQQTFHTNCSFLVRHTHPPQVQYEPNSCISCTS